MPTLNKDIRVLIDEFDVSTDHRGGSIGFTTPALDTTTLQHSGRTLLPGPPEGTIDLQAYWMGGNAGDIETKLRARFATATEAVVSVLIDTTATAKPAYVMMAAAASALKTEMPISELLMLSSTWTDALERGLSVVHATISATGGMLVSGIDFATAGTAGGWAVAHIRAISGTATDAAFTLQSSAASSMTSPTNHGTFTFSAVGAYVITWTGATGRYLRPTVTTLGGATSFGVTVIAGVTGVTG